MFLQIQEPDQENTTLDEIAIGIDLGTTNSVIAIVQDGKTIILQDHEGHRLIPSVAAYTPNPIIGHRALDHLSANPEEVIRSIKRHMHEAALELKIGNTTVTPLQVSADILRYLKQIAEQALDQPVSKAVITVPAYFNEASRTATRDAAQLAGLEVLRLVNEPTAAAIAYGLDAAPEGIYAVYDLGGGTFDISILQMTKGVFQVLATGGDTQLGGDDIDMAIAHHFLGKDIPTQEHNIASLQARRLKEALTTQDTVTSPLLNQTVTLDRPTLNSLLKPLVDRTLSICKRTLQDAHMASPEGLAGVILVGGATRIPYLQEQVAAFFGKEPLHHLNEDEVVAMGAALQAESLVQGTGHLLLDVTPLSLGLETMGGLVEKLIHRNTPIPTQATQEFTTYQDGQGAMSIHVVQGEREMAQDCQSLARFTLRGIPPLPAGAPRIQVKFALDADGLLSVTAQETTTGIMQHIEVKPSYGLSQDTILQMLSDSYAHAAGDLASRSIIAARVDTERLWNVVQGALQEDKALWESEPYQAFQDRLQDLRNQLGTMSKEDLLQANEQLRGHLTEIIQHRLQQKRFKV